MKQFRWWSLVEALWYPPKSPLTTNYFWSGQIKNDILNALAIVPIEIWSGNDWMICQDYSSTSVKLNVRTLCLFALHLEYVWPSSNMCLLYYQLSIHSIHICILYIATHRYMFTVMICYLVRYCPATPWFYSYTSAQILHTTHNHD